MNRWTAGADRLPGYGDEASLWQASTRCAFSEEAAAEKHMAQLQHNMWVTNARWAVLSIITGGGKWIEMTVETDFIWRLTSSIAYLPQASLRPFAWRRYSRPPVRVSNLDR